MSGFFSVLVIVLALLTLGISLFLFFWAMRVRIPTHEDGTTGHVWAHGVLREAVRPLPLWWALLSAGAFLFGAIYLARYPGLGNFKGYLGWSSQGELQLDVASNQAKLAALIEPTRASSLEQLAGNERALDLGHRLYLDNCAACHGQQAQGNHTIGAPGFSDSDWLYGGSAEAILASINDGRNGQMPPLESVLGFKGVDAVAAYVLSLNGRQVPPENMAPGKAHFDSLCAACHGADGRGNVALGAPNLVDGIWLYGGSLNDVFTSIGKGRSGVMPAWRTRLNSDEVRLVAAWVMAQGRKEARPK